ncbi:deoxyribose-phosphate aldolase [Anoxybacter fermentans]|uniref:Deoxyribose-phosphate aldolase n=1 Tax=Anoxybacter fermentans TaxID=1323375 RepID=A0A3S9SXU1_9FIRM|nr:deoxyribose-phosphate aldolase [Anoxybacter fermentans]AZR73147.1 deoxyribose-phosphate aldolase [Anoxybacter fermentans]
MAMKPRDLSKMIDHTLLKPTANVYDIKKLCKEALKYKFASVCVNPIFVPMCVKLLKGSSVKVTTVIGYPLGANTTEAKAFQTRQVVKEGAQEIDMVMNLGAFKSGAFDLVKADIKAVVDAARVSSLGPGALVKVNIECSYLSDEEIIKACTLAVEGGADFVVTSTGFGPYRTTGEHVSLIRKTVGREIGVKASGGIKTFEEAVDMLDAGANRIGTDFGVYIVTGEEEES